MKKVGILGGTFDPVHLGHLKVAASVQKKLELDEIIFIPAKIPPLKERPKVSAEARLAMVKKAIEGRINWSVADLELKRAGNSYTVDTIKELKKARPAASFFYLLGSDAMEFFPRWKKPLKIMELVARLIVVNRPGHSLKKIEEFLLKEPFVKLKDKVQFLKIKSIDISATELRAAQKRGEDVTRLLDRNVWDYIKKEKLYI